MICDRCGRDVKGLQEVWWKEDDWEYPKKLDWCFVCVDAETDTFVSKAGITRFPWGSKK